MAEETKKKSGRKAGDTLETIGTVGSLLTPLLFGPEMGQSFDLGAPFKKIAERQRETAREQGLLDILGGSPEGQALIQGGMDVASQGGLLGQLFTTPEAVQTLIESGNAPLASQIVHAQAQQKPIDPLDQQMKMADLVMKQLNIKGFETPEQKRQRDLEADVTKTLATESGKLQLTAGQNEGFDPEIKMLGTTQTDLNKNQQLQELYRNTVRTLNTPKLQSLFNNPGVVKHFFMATSDKIADKDAGRVWLSTNAPELLQLTQELEEVTFKRVFTDSGAQVTDKEREAFKKFMPRLTDTAEGMEKRFQSLIAASRYAELTMLANNAKAGQTKNFLPPLPVLGNPNQTLSARQQLNLFQELRGYLQAPNLTKRQKIRAEVLMTQFGMRVK